jgi:hypothetical protein
MANILFQVEQENRLNQDGLLKRFNSLCIGNQENLITMRQQKTDKFKELINKRDTREYMSWFLKYNPLLDKRPYFIKNKTYNDKLLFKKRKVINSSRKKEDIKNTRITRRRKYNYNDQPDDKIFNNDKNVFGWK